MNERPILVIPRGSAKQRDLRTLRDAGVLVLEVTDPAVVRYCRPPPPAVDGLPLATLQVMDEWLTKGNHFNSTDFAARVFRVMLKRTVAEKVQEAPS